MQDENIPDETQRTGELLQNVLAAPDPVREILKLILEQVDRKDPELGQVIRFLAIPRRFDSEIIGILRAAPAETEKNQGLLSEVLRFSFVHTQSDGGYSYDDDTRRVLLKNWRADDRRAQFNEHNQQLLDFYKGRHQEAKQLQYDLDTVGKLIKEGNADRYVQIASAVEKQAVGPLLEALYHQSLISTEEAFTFFTINFEDYEARGRLRVSEVLLHNAREYLGTLPPGSGQDPLLKWLQYYHARLKRDRRAIAQAESMLRELLPQTGEDTKLKLWILADLAEIIRQQYKLAEAREVYQQLLQIAEETKADPYNLPTWQNNAAGLDWILIEISRAADKYRQVIQSAQEIENPVTEVYARMNLSGVLQDLGQLDEALDAGLEGLDVARKMIANDPSMYHYVSYVIANRFIQLFTQRDEVRLLETAFCEALATRFEQDDPGPTLDLRNQYGKALLAGNQLSRADKALSQLKEKAAKKADPSFAMELLLQEAVLREAQGLLDKAFSLYTSLAEVAKPNIEGSWYYGTALNGAGKTAERMGRWADADANFTAAIKKWKSVGHDKLIGVVRLNQASAARRQGKLVEAQNYMDEAHQILAGELSTLLADCHWSQGKLYASQARWPNALEEYQKGLEIYRQFNQHREVAQILDDMAKAAYRQTEWEKAAEYLYEVHKIFQQIAAADRYRPSKEALRSNQKNAEAIRLFANPVGERQGNLEAAVEELREAIKIEKNNFLYRLNLSKIYAALEWWEQAANEIACALDYGPTWLRRPLLHQQLVEYTLRRGETLAQQGLFEEAASYYRRARERFESHLPLQQWAQVWIKLGDNLLRQSDWTRARTEFESGLAQVTKISEPALQAAFHTRLGFLDAVRADVAAAREHFWQSLDLRIQTSGESAIQELVNDISDLVVAGQQYHTFGVVLRVLNQDSRLNLKQHRQLREARLQFTRENYHHVAHPLKTDADIPAESFTPLSTPIILEADDNLFPLGKDTPEVIRMLNDEHGDIVEMRNRIQEDTGVWIPGVRIRGNLDLMEGSYIIRLSEIPVSFGQVFVGKKYCPDGAACTALGVETFKPYNPQNKGVWLGEQSWAVVESAGLPLWDIYRTMLFYLEGMIRNRLQMFLGIQEAAHLLTDWENQDQSSQSARHGQRENALPDEQTLVRFVQVLKNLVKEGMPLKNLGEILAAFAEHLPYADELIDLVENIRVVLKTDLPGNQPGRMWIPLPDEFEKIFKHSIQEREGKHFLAAPPKEIELLRNVLVELIGDQPLDSIALVASSAQMRPFVYRLVEDLYPELAVLSEAEVQLETLQQMEHKEDPKRIEHYTSRKTNPPGSNQALQMLIEYRK